MKRSLVVLLALSLFLAACATTTPAPSVSGVVTQRSGNVLTVTPAEGGQPATVNVVYGTRVFWYNGLEGERSAITTGMPVKVWLSNGTQNAAKIVISQ